MIENDKEQQYEPKLKKMKNSNLIPSSLCDDVVYEILMYFKDFKFLVLNCSLVSKQWYKIILERNINLYARSCNKLNGDFIKNISSIVLTLDNFDFTKLQMMKSLTSIYCCGGIKSLKLLSDYMKENENLTTLYLRHHKDELKHLREMKHLTELCVKFNEIRLTELLHLCDLKNLKKLNLAYNYLDDYFSENFENFEYFTIQLKQLTILNISSNCLGDEGAKHLSNNMTLLTKLCISNSGLRCNGAFYISNNLKQLKTLDISYNEIGDKGCKFISEMNQLTSLDVSRNRITTNGAFYISKMKQLIKLYINSNDIGNLGIFRICYNLKQLTKLGCYYTDIEKVVLEYFGQLKNLTFLDLRTNFSCRQEEKQKLSNLKIKHILMDLNTVQKDYELSSIARKFFKKYY